MSRAKSHDPAAAAPETGISLRKFRPATLGTCFGILAAVAYTAANTALRQVAYQGDVDWAMWVSCNKAIPAAIAAWSLIAWRAGRGLPALPPRHLIVPLFLTGLFIQFGGNVLFQMSLSIGGLALTVPLTFSTLMISGAVLGRMMLEEPITGRSAYAMFIQIAAIVLLSLGAEKASIAPVASLSAVLGAVATSCIAGMAYGASGVIIRRTVTNNVPLSATLVLLSTAGVVGLGGASLVRLGPRQLLATPPQDLLTMLMAGTFNAIAFFSIGAALKHVSVVQANLLNASQIAMAAAVGVLLFDETLTVWLAAGMLLTIVGLTMIERPRPDTLEDVEPN